jgi:hypothetical protein
MSRLGPHPLLCFAVTAGLIACTAALPEPTPADAERAQAMWEDASMSQLAHGRTLLVDHCSGCHVVPLPNAHAPEQWPGIVEEMAEPAGLSRSEVESVVRYLVVASTSSGG